MDEGLVLAADVNTLIDLKKLCFFTTTIPEFVAVKVGCMLGLKYGLKNVVQAVQGETDKLEVIYDHQKAGTDIPAMGKPFAEVCAEAGVSKVIIFPQAGPTTLAAFVAGCRECEITPIVGLTMSHDRYLSSEGGWIDDSAPGRILLTACEVGVDRFVLPGNKLDLTIKYSDELSRIGVKATIYMPGIGTQGGEVNKACTAVMPHRARPIIGSAIYKANDPIAAMLRFAQELDV